MFMKNREVISLKSDIFCLDEGDHLRPLHFFAERSDESDRTYL